MWSRCGGIFWLLEVSLEKGTGGEGEGKVGAGNNAALEKCRRSDAGITEQHVPAAESEKNAYRNAFDR